MTDTPNPPGMVDVPEIKKSLVWNDQFQGLIHPDDPGEPTTDRPRIGVTDEEGWFLAGAAAGRTVLEIGTGLGISTCWLAKTASVVVTIDPDPWVQARIVPGLPENVLARTGLVAVPQNFFAFDVVFIDGDHATESVMRDIADARRWSPSVIVCHDAKEARVADGLDRADPSWLLVESHFGLGVIKSLV